MKVYRKLLTSVLHLEIVHFISLIHVFLCCLYIEQSTEEIEIEIDQLPGSVLIKLYNFVLRPVRGSGPSKRARGAGKGTGTGGLKRKSMDEDVEAEKIRALEERMKMFEGGAVGASLPASGRAAHDSEHSSDSSSDDSSGSESD